MSRAILLVPPRPFMRHPLKPHQLVDRVTRAQDTIVLCHLGVPRLHADDWSLSIDGLVRRPLRLRHSQPMADASPSRERGTQSIVFKSASRDGT